MTDQLTEVRVVTIGNATLYLGDSAEIIPALQPVNAVITDPPYGVAYVTGWREVMDTPPAIIGDDNPPLASVQLMADALKENGALYLATRFDVSAMWVDAIRQAGLTLKTPIYWDKCNHTSGDLEGDFGAQVEIFIFAHKGRHKLRGPRLPNLWRVPRDPASAHPTPKPVALMEKMVACSTDQGDVVLDPFMGSGSTGVACMHLGRKFIGVEIEPKYFEIACERIDQAQRQGRMFA